MSQQTTGLDDSIKKQFKEVLISQPNGIDLDYKQELNDVSLCVPEIRLLINLFCIPK